MASYYYLISSLPMLKADSEPPFSYNEFAETCEQFLSESKAAAIKNLTLDFADAPLLKQWALFYKVFKSELSYQRNLKLKKQVNPPEERDENITKAVAAAIAEKNPLVAEKMLLALQFEKLDEMIGLHDFDDEALFGYAIKLKLLERKSSFDQKRGKQQLNDILENLQEQILSIG